MYRIVNTDNFGRDYPDEYFVDREYETKEAAEELARELNEADGKSSPRYHKVVETPYELVPGFEP
jgi:hypothetical protein